MHRKKIIRRDAVLSSVKFDKTLPPTLQRIYAARSVQDSRELQYSLDTLLPYQSLCNIDHAVECLTNALAQQFHILVIGDFDADGATSTAVAVSALRAMGAKKVSYLVPNRFTYGYGLTPEIVDAAARLDPNLIITVDNGIASHEGIARAYELGIHVLVTDHHLPGTKLPEKAIIVNPNQPGDHFPSKCLAGVGVIFYVMLALRACLRARGWFQKENIEPPNMAQFLDLVALGTVADVVPLDHNNRILVHQGIQRIRAGHVRPGIKALLAFGQRAAHQIAASDLGFIIGPRLNAAGRLDDMSLGIECLLAEDFTRAQTMAHQLDQLNQERRTIEMTMQQQAFSYMQNQRWKTSARLPYGLCLFEEDWHQGVIGIVASRVKDYAHRPVIAFARMNDRELKGSARSIPGIHIRDVLDNIATRHPHVIQKFGGHAMAAGLSIDATYFAEFSQLFAETVQHWAEPHYFEPIILSDGALMPSEVTLSFAEQLMQAGPWGQAFPEPIFDGYFQVREQRLVGGKHLKLSLVMDGDSRVLDAIAFNVDENKRSHYSCERIQAAYQLDVNEYRACKKLQLILTYFELC